MFEVYDFDDENNGIAGLRCDKEKISRKNKAHGVKTKFTNTILDIIHLLFTTFSYL